MVLTPFTNADQTTPRVWDRGRGRARSPRDVGGGCALDVRHSGGSFDAPVPWTTGLRALGRVHADPSSDSQLSQPQFSPLGQCVWPDSLPPPSAPEAPMTQWKPHSQTWLERVSLVQ